MKKIIMFFIAIISMVIFGMEEMRAPNEIITTNPEREVTTVESLKTRDHATMSLSVTKVIPEEIMGKLENGKLSVFISKSQQESKKSNKMNSIDITKFKLKAYSNPKTPKPMTLKMNLSAEDIRNMQKDVSKEKKINVVENTDKYVRLEVENVDKDEKIYISVMNGDKVIKAYRIGEVTPRETAAERCWGHANGNISQEHQTYNSMKTILPYTGGWVDWNNFRFTLNSDAQAISGIYEIKLATYPQSGQELLFKDYYLGERKITVKKIAKDSGFRVVISPNNYLNNIGGMTSFYNYAHSATRLDGGTLVTGEKVEGAPGDAFQYRNSDNPLAFGFEVNGSKKRYDTFNYLHIYDISVYNNTCGTSTAYDKTKSIIGRGKSIGPNFGIELNKNGKNYPGVYTYNNAISIDIKSVKQNKVTKTANYYIDIGDASGEETHTPKNKTINLYDTVGNISTILNDNSDDTGLSFMVEPNQITGTTYGIYYNNNVLNNPGKITINSTDNKSTIEVTVKQEKNEFAKLEVKLTKNNSTESPSFNFALVQGRKVDGKLRPLRTINYTLKYPKVETVGDITLTVDPRLAKIASAQAGKVDWITGNKEFGGWEQTARDILPGFIYVDNKINKNTTITDVESVGNKIKNSGASNNYITFKGMGNNAYNEIALKTNVALNSYGSTNNLMVSPAKEETFSTIFNDSQKNSYRSNIKVQFAKGVTREGYSGNGTLDMSSGKLNTEYSFTKDKLIVEGMTMNVIGTFPNTYGVIAGQTNQSVANGTTLTCANSAYQCVQMFLPNGQSLGKWKIQNKEGTVAYLWVELTKDNQLKLTKSNDNFDFFNDNNKLTLTYHNENKKINKKIILGTFDLKIKSERKIKPLTEMNFEVDSRIVSVTKGEWISPNGDVWDSNGTKIGSYPDFIRAYQSTKNNYADDIMVTKVTKINNTTSLNNNSELKYFYLKESGNNNTALPYNVPISTYNTTSPNTKIIISKADLNSSKQVRATMEKRNTFELEDNKGEQWAGSLKEKYIDTKINNDGSGTLNLIGATLNKEYSFTAGQSGNINSGNEEERITLKVDSGKKSLDATGVVTKTSENVANKMIVKVGKEKTEIIKNKNLEATILENKVKIGINNKGELTVTKLKEENIASTEITIDYYYDIDNDDLEPSDGNFIKLGTFTLTLSNPVITSSTDITVKIDKRFLQAENTPNWLFKNGKVVQDILKETNSGNNGIDYSGLYKYEGNLQSQNGSINKALGVEGREDRQIGSNYDGFKVNDLGAEKWRDEAAAPKTGQMSNIDNLVVVSKGNKKESPNLDNKFSLLYIDNGEKKIYKGNVKEEIVGSGKSDGNGSINIRDLKKGVKYIFPTTGSGNTVEGSDSDKKEKVTMTISGTNGTPIMPNGWGLAELSNKILANKITIDNTPNNGGLEVTKDSFTFGIDSTTGGFTIKNDNSQNLTEDKSYEIKFWYKPNGSIKNNDEVLLSAFKLTIKKETFEIDGENTLDFGKMFYRESAPFETRVKQFNVKNPDKKKIDFKVEKNTSKMTLLNKIYEEGKDSFIDLKDINVAKKSDTSFELGATAVLTPKTQVGVYQGEIEVIVTITDKKQ